MKIGILGTGNVGRSLGTAFAREGHDVKFGSRDPAKTADEIYKLGKGFEVAPLRDATEWAELIVLAVPYHNAKDTLSGIGAASFKGKIILDVTNPLTPTFELALGFSWSGAEEIQKVVPAARVVKAFNHVFADNMRLGRIGASKLVALVAADDDKAKETVLGLARAIGFDAVDAGPLKSARYLEPMAMQLITLGYGMKMGTGTGFALARAR